MCSVENIYPSGETLMSNSICLCLLVPLCIAVEHVYMNKLIAD